MKIEKFKVIELTRNLILSIEKDLDNFPKKDIEIKRRIRKNSYDLLELEYEANETKDIDYKKQLLYKIKAKIKVIDFLLNLSYDKKLINEKKYIKLGNIMEDIIKYVSGWQNRIPDRKSTRLNSSHRN